MYKHQKEGLEKATEYFKSQENVIALILGGSIAHGFYNEKSDIDVMIIVTNDEYLKKKENDSLTYYSDEFTNYEGGYVDGKFLTIDMLKLIKEKGNEAFRYAFKDSKLIFTKSEVVKEIIKDIPVYPVDEKDERITRFYAQVEAWKWHYYEGLKRDNKFLINSSVSNFVLFTTRLILAQNEMLYPYHKWMIEELKKCSQKPENIIEKMEELIEKMDEKSFMTVYNMIIETIDEKYKKSWSNIFHKDIEIPWMQHEPYVGDL